MRSPILTEYLSRRGATKRLAEACGVTHAAVSQWRAVPERHILTVAKVIGTTPEELVPRSDRPARDAA